MLAAVIGNKKEICNLSVRVGLSLQAIDTVQLSVQMTS